MRRTLLTFTALAALTVFGYGSTAALGPADETIAPSTYAQLDTTEPEREPVARDGQRYPTPAPVVSAAPTSSTPAPSTSTTPTTRTAAPVAGVHVDEAPALAAVTPLPAPVVDTPAVECPCEYAPPGAFYDTPEPEFVQEQLADETIGRAIDAEVTE